jgi:hypothetical protein
LRVARKTYHCVDKVGAADNADEPSVAHHWEPLDAAALHQLDDNLQRIILADEDGIGRHDLIHLSAEGMYVLTGEPAGSQQELEPRWPRTLRPEFATPEKISLGHDTDEIATGIDDGKAADPVLQHQTRGCKDRITDGHGNHFPGHDITDLHGRSPFALSSIV